MKSKIINTSILLFEKKGFSQTSIQDIVDALGVTKGTFYYYFSSKEELLMDIHLQYIDDLLKRQNLILSGPNSSCRGKIEEIIDLLISDIKNQGPSARVFFRELRHLNGENVAMIKNKRAEFRLGIEHLVQEGVEKGEFKSNLKADLVAFGILGVTNWSYQWFNPDGKVADKELSAIFTDMILNGIAL
jgi:TetR/AcrR family transcriptional regulator, cholesterol catabolism regulator